MSFHLGHSLDASFAFIELLNSVQVNHLLDECQVHGSEDKGFDSQKDQHARAARAVDVTLRNILSTRKEICTLIVTKKLCCSLNRNTALLCSFSLHLCISRSKSEELAPRNLHLAWEMVPKVMVWAPSTALHPSL